MFMDEKQNERFLQALERRNELEHQRVQQARGRVGWKALLVIVATPVWGIPLAVTLWRAAFGN